MCSIGGHRTYPPDTVELIVAIKAAQRLGFSLEEIVDLLEAGRRGHRSGDLRRRAVDKLVETDRKLADLAAIRYTLARVVQAECDSLTNCTCPDCPLPAPVPADLGRRAS